jgi:TRAP-type C4-dicarboxylate transport system permease small subunit
MATKEQYEFFRSLYEDEERTYAQLEARARFYLSIVSIFLASVLLKTEEVQKSARALGLPWWLVLGEAVLLSGALLFVTLGALIRRYEGIADPEDIVKSFGEDVPSNEQFFDDRIADYTVATNRNAAVNERTARLLSYAGILLSASMVLLLGLFGFALRA